MLVAWTVTEWDPWLAHKYIGLASRNPVQITILKNPQNYSILLECCQENDSQLKDEANQICHWRRKTACLWLQVHVYHNVEIYKQTEAKPAASSLSPQSMIKGHQHFQRHTLALIDWCCQYIQAKPYCNKV